MPKKSLENLTEPMFYILMAFSTGPLCGQEVADFVEHKTEGRVKLGPATLYTLLAKYEKAAYISQIDTNGRKRTYQITKTGLTAYQEEVARLRQCVVDASQEEDTRFALHSNRENHVKTKGDTYERYPENRAF